jgi:uncharacterized membrane protein
MAHTPPETAAQEARDELGLERIVFFSDAVIAIAITLLVLDIRLPELHGDPADELPRARLGLWPRYGSFLLSFLVVGTYWWGQHRLFRVVRRYDEMLLWLNILFLACIAFIPFASAVLGEHGDQPSAAVFYALVIAATGLVEAEGITNRGRSPGPSAARGDRRRLSVRSGLSCGTSGSASPLSNDQAPPVCYALLPVGATADLASPLVSRPTHASPGSGSPRARRGTWRVGLPHA